jgi:OOP family OmpA-OmpF porin
MTRRINLLLTLALVFIYGASYAQEKNEWGEPKMPENFAKEETSSNKEKTKKWIGGDSKYYAKPKNMWELGVGIGHFFIDGDVDPTSPKGTASFPAGFGASLHLRKAINYVFSIRAELMYGRAFGLDPQKTSSDVMNQEYNYGLANANLYTGGMLFNRNFKEQHFSGNLQLVFNVGNLLFHKERNKWNWYAWIGTGLNHNKTEIDLLNGSGQAYNTSSLPNDTNTKAGRKEIKSQLRDMYDGEYETLAAKKRAIFRIGDETNIHVEFVGGTGIARRINRRFNIALEHQVFLQDNDLLDGFVYRTGYDQTNDEDVPHFTSLRFNFNLGSFDKRVEPLYWLNPLDAPLNDIAALKQRPELNLSDTDKDGVIDMLDQEKDTPGDCPVDTRGVTLDSDGDGVPDCKDKEPYSPPGFEVDKDGVADIPKDVDKFRTDGEIIDLINKSACCNKATVVQGGATEWLLPMVHYDLKKCSVKPDAAAELYQIAEIMKKYPNICVTATGYSDSYGENGNQVLAYMRAQAAVDYIVNNYGIDRSRLSVQYGVGGTQIVPSSAGSFVNRRVEFQVGSCGQASMGRPEGNGFGDCGGGSYNTRGVSKSAY